MLRPAPGETVLDPACGSGGFLMHSLNHVRPGLGAHELRQYCRTKLWGFDIDARAVRVAKALLVLAGTESMNVVRLNSLLRPGMQPPGGGTARRFGGEVVLTGAPVSTVSRVWRRTRSSSIPSCPRRR